MRLTSLRLRGVTRFTDDVEVDFSSIPPGLVCVAGSNGAGKTTLLGASGPGPVYRDLPPRSGDWLLPGGHVELGFDLAGREYVTRLWRTKAGATSATLKIDGERKAGPKVRAYDAAIRDLLGPPEAFYASAYAAQGGSGRLGALGPAERRKLFRFYLGLDRIQAVADAAKSRIGAYDLGAYEAKRRSANETKREAKAAEARLARAVTAEGAARSERDRARAILDDLARELSLLPKVEEYRVALSRAGDLARRFGAAKCATPSADMRRIRDAGLALLPEARTRVDRAREASSLHREAEAAFAAAEARCGRAEEGWFSPPDPEGFCSGCEFVQAAGQERSNAIASQRAAAAEVIRLGGVGEGAEAAEARLKKLTASVNAAEKLLAQAQEAERAEVEAEDARLLALEKRRELPSSVPGARTLREAEEARSHATRLSDQWATANALLSAAAEAYSVAEKAVLAAEKAWTEAEGRLTDLAPLELLAEAFGPTGLQAMEIDAAGPAFTAIADKLVDACFPGRFRIELATQREKKGGGTAETFDVVVYDSERGREGPIEMLSGGEQVVMDEAIRTALAIVGTDRGAWSHRWRTLWRDETPANLYGEVAERYLAMLARAREVGGYHHLIVVGGEHVALGADTVIRVSPEGAVRVER